MKFNEYNDFIEKHKYDMLHFIIYYNLKTTLVNDFNQLTNDDLIKIISFTYETYLKDENGIDLAIICEKAMEHKEDIIHNKYDEFLGHYTFTKWDLLEACYE